MNTKKILLPKIQMEIANVNDFTIKKERLGNRLIIASFICAGFTSLLTGGEAGGLWIHAGLGQAVMILAAVCAFAATVMTGIYKQLVIPSQLADAQTGKTDLENLELEVGHFKNDADLAEATKRFEQIRKSVYFIPDDPGIELIALRQVTGKIKEAVAHDALNPDIFDCSGEVENMSNGLHLWLAVKNKGGRGWPTDSEFGYSPRGGSPCDGSWEHQFGSEGDSKKFTVALLVTNGQANQEIYKWINRCNSKAKYPVFKWPRTGGIKELDKRTILRHKQGTQPAVAA